MRVAANECQDALNSSVSSLFKWDKSDRIEWRSPVADDAYAEYFDQEFLDRLGIRALKVPLSKFWPRGGPRWDGLARTKSGRLLLVEAKAYIEEAVDYRSRASRDAFRRIRNSLRLAKRAFGATKDASWESPFYQYANRLAHLYFMRDVNGLDAYLLFLYFADAPDVPNPCTTQQWQGARRLTEKCLGITRHAFRPFIGSLIWSVPEMLSTRGLQQVTTEGHG